MYSSFTLFKKYAQYYFAASNGRGHGVHSPFVFGFIQHVLNDKKQYDCYAGIEAVRNKMRRDHTIIEVEDLGAGSAAIRSNARSIKQIAGSSLKPRKFAQLLFRMVRYYKPAVIVELGTSLGVTSAYLASGNEDAKLYTMEGAPSIAAIASTNFKSLSIQNIELIKGDFAATLPVTLSRIPPIDFAFIDGNHRKQPTLDYFRQLLDHSTHSTILVFDDIHWSGEMEEAWETVKSDPGVTLTIDLFFIGLVFLNPDFKEKQHFSIRF